MNPDATEKPMVFNRGKYFQMSVLPAALPLLHNLSCVTQANTKQHLAVTLQRRDKSHGFTKLFIVRRGHVWLLGKKMATKLWASHKISTAYPEMFYAAGGTYSFHYATLQPPTMGVSTRVTGVATAMGPSSCPGPKCMVKGPSEV